MAEKTDAISSYLTKKLVSYTDYIKPQAQYKLYQKYGKQYGTLRNIFALMGRERMISGDSTFGFQDRRYHEVLICGQNVGDPGAGNPITFNVDTDNIDSAGNTYVREGDVVTTPGEVACSVTNVTKTNPTTISVTLTPFDSSKTIGAVTDGMELSISSGAFGAGGGWPAPALSYPEKVTFYVQEIKESFGAVGSRLADEFWAKENESGKKLDTLFSEQYIQAEFRMDAKENGMMWTGELNTNNVATPDGQEAGEDIITSKGIIPTIRTEGYTIPYPVGGWTIQYLYDIDRYLTREGCGANVVVIKAAPLLMQEIQTALANNFKNTGVNYAVAPESLFKISNKSEVDMQTIQGLMATLNFQSLLIGSRTFVFHSLFEFDDPKTFGAVGYNFNKYGVVMPMFSMQDAKDPKKIYDNIGLIYKGLGSYNRRRGVGTMSGSVFGGNQPVLELDETKTLLHSHIGLEIYKANQLVLMEPDA